MSGHEKEPPDNAVVEKELNAHSDARAIIRLVQCSQCSFPFREPMTLPCGKSMCRKCLPPLHKREHITYPQTAGRTEGFVCIFDGCGLEHSLGDCSTDVTLNKLMEVIRNHMRTYQVENSATPLLVEEKIDAENIGGSSMGVAPRSRVLPGGRIVATYLFADMGELSYSSEVGYTPIDPHTADSVEALDVAVLEHIKEMTRIELECQVCYGLMLDPLTTACGHTFCRKCVARVLDHSNLCPVCRRRLTMPPGVQTEPKNELLSVLLETLLPDLLALRLSTVALDETVDENANIPLFPCTLAYPMMPMFLHIFEPRYRLMIRRAIETGGGKFGMMMYNHSRRPQGQLGQSHFMEYGTLLHIESLQMLRDGRSLIETIGLSRFRVLEASMHDGYQVGRIERVDDISVAEEEAIEAAETSTDIPHTDDVLGEVNHMSTQALLQYGLDFITQARARSAPWLHDRVLSAYGQPPSDPAIFPYWFASVLPINEEEKYLLLPTNSVRARLKITAKWIQRLEAARCIREAVLRRSVLDSSSDEGEEEVEAMEADVSESTQPPLRNSSEADSAAPPSAHATPEPETEPERNAD